MKYLSVCSGIEAATVAWHPLGWQLAGVSEIEPFSSAVLAHHYSGVPNFGDFTTIKADDVGPIDLLVGGTPCQSFSVAGLRGGLDDDRGNLSLEFCRLAQRARPRWIVWENVPGVLSMDGGQAFASILGGLAECGYGLAYRVLDAQYVRVDGFARAVPQRRRRVFVVGYLGDWRRAAAVLFERSRMRRDTPPRREARQDVAGTIGAGLARCSADDADRGGLIAHTLNAKGGVGRPLYGIDVAMPQTRRNGDPGVVAFAENSRAELRLCGGDGSVAAQLTTGGGKPGQGQSCIYTLAIRGREGGHDLEYRTDGTANAIVIPNGGRAGIGVGAIADAWAVRRLTPTECERLQGFPDGYTAITYRGKPAADGHRYKALGNSMAVNCMRWIGMRIDRVDALGQFMHEAAE